MQPRQSRETVRPVEPSVVYCMRAVLRRRRDEPRATKVPRGGQTFTTGALGRRVLGAPPLASRLADKDENRQNPPSRFAPSAAALRANVQLTERRDRPKPGLVRQVRKDERVQHALGALGERCC